MSNTILQKLQSTIAKDIAPERRIGDVICPNSTCNAQVCDYKETFPRLGRKDYSCAQCKSICRILNIPFTEQANSFLSNPGLYVFERKRNEITNIIGDVYCPDRKCVNQKCLYMCTSKNNCKSSYECLQCNASLTVQNIPFMDQKHLWTLFGGDGTHVFTPKTAKDYEREATNFRAQPMLTLKKKPASNKNSL